MKMDKKIYKVVLIRNYEENLCITLNVLNVRKALNLMIKDGNFALYSVPMGTGEMIKKKGKAELNLIVFIVEKKHLGYLLIMINDFAQKLVRENIILIIKNIDKNLQKAGENLLKRCLKKENISEVCTLIPTEELCLKMSSKKYVGYVPQLNHLTYTI
jgi:hypothetical protein